MNKGNIYGTVILIFVIIALCFYIAYDKGFIVLGEKQEENQNFVTEVQLELSSQLVQSLYMMVESDYRCFNTITLPAEQNIIAKNIDFNTKFQMGVELLLDSDKEILECNKYDVSKYFSEVSSNIACGDNKYDANEKKFLGEEPTTILIKEDKISKRINQIFGPSTYDRKDVIEYASIEYKYIEEEQGYVVLKVPVSGTCTSHTNNLLSASMKDGKVYIKDEKKFEDGEIFIYTYIFKPDEANNYRLENIISKESA